MNYFSVFRLLAFITLFVAGLMVIPFSSNILSRNNCYLVFHNDLALMLLTSLTIIIATQRKHSALKISVKASYLCHTNMALNIFLEHFHFGYQIQCLHLLSAILKSCLVLQQQEQLQWII